MKPLLFSLILTIFLFSCQTEEPQEVTRSTIYTLYRANFNPVSGDVEVKELSPGVLEVTIKLINTDPNGEHPAHLHFGSVREVGELAFALEPINGETGISKTVLNKVMLTNGDLLTYDNFMEMDGSIKVHMNDNYFKHMVLAFGNVGKNEDYFFEGVSVCTGH